MFGDRQIIAVGPKRFNGKKQYYWVQCECLSDPHLVDLQRLKAHPKCLQCAYKIPKSHGHAFRGEIDPLYVKWCGIVYNRKKAKTDKYRKLNPLYQESWAPENNGFLNFHNWITTKYPDIYELMEKKYSLERVDNNIGYFDWNCIMADLETQARNKDTTIRVPLKNGKTMALKDVWEITKSPIIILV